MILPSHWHHAGPVLYRRSDGCEVLKDKFYSQRNIGAWRVWFAGYLIRRIHDDNTIGHIRSWHSYQAAMRWADEHIPFQIKSLEGQLIERN
jgi:hypothetical protein